MLSMQDLAYALFFAVVTFSLVGYIIVFIVNIIKKLYKQHKHLVTISNRELGRYFKPPANKI